MTKCFLPLIVRARKVVLRAKLKTVTAAMLALVASGDGSFSRRGTAVGQEIDKSEPKDKKPANRPIDAANKEAEKLVRQLGSPLFSERDAAEKALRSIGARAATAVRAGMDNADLEIARRCAAIWPQLWQTEFARPNADRFADDEPVWIRFRKIAGDDPGSRALFAEMLADVRRFTLLETAEADPAKAGDVYDAELKLRVERMKEAYAEAMRNAGGRSGWIRPASGGIPSRGEHATLLFLGTYPSTAAITFREAHSSDMHPHRSVFFLPFDDPKSMNIRTNIPRAERRLFAAWLHTRTDSGPIQIGLNIAFTNKFSEVLPSARTSAANAKLDAAVRGSAVIAVGQFGGLADLPLLEKAFADNRVFYKHISGNDPDVLVSDVAIAAALQLSGQHPADFAFPFAKKQYGPDAIARFHLLGFSNGESRQAAHMKAKEWLATQPTRPSPSGKN